MRTVYTIWIDFGTSNSCVTYASYYDRGNGEVDPDPLQRPEAIPALKNVFTYDRGPLADLSEHERIWVGGRQSTIFILTII